MYITAGVFFLFFSQVVINVGMNVGLLPVDRHPFAVCECRWKFAYWGVDRAGDHSEHCLTIKNFEILNFCGII